MVLCLYCTKYMRFYIQLMPLPFADNEYVQTTINILNCKYYLIK